MSEEVYLSENCCYISNNYLEVQEKNLKQKFEEEITQLDSSSITPSSQQKKSMLYQTKIHALENFIEVQYQIINRQDRLIDCFCFIFLLTFGIVTSFGLP
ncbi:unnamed protein product [Rhizophagus irregularis]|uniref:Uncharacterized protein n=1 Tax=Rhizophagus irregularis TaxID=588596 RepID=A0A2I1HSC1_9GLOM|nr:hypothetical protein RhiirA4_487165 [Rhizophagus irregularis]CAB4423417.1 unnamed protein product [Rhizophagus irregularis]CAB4423731.1 unnamed protein product [Rhizophagus irregularis]